MRLSAIGQGVCVELGIERQHSQHERLCCCVSSTRLSRRFPPWKKAINGLVGIAQLVENMTTGRDTMALEYEAPSGA